MPANAQESMIWTKNATKRTLSLVFDEGDDVLAGLLSAMTEHRIADASIVEVNGKLKGGLGNYMMGSRLLSFNFSDTHVKTGTGHFKRSKDGLFGVLKVIPSDDNNMVTIAKGIAGQDFQIQLSYYEF
ncbi:MAG: hypothetical protein Q7R47_01955 [Candidatus Diapherotrites archaeon]|nr:hypothetical protein [Candidatus Diapherotrites archaeon]